MQKLGPEKLHCMLMGFEDYSAIVVSTFAFINEKGEVSLFSGETTGTIVPPICSTTTVPEIFGWESCFKPDGYDVTYAELPKKTVDFLSPRMKATLKLKEFFGKTCKTYIFIYLTIASFLILIIMQYAM